MSKLLSNLIHRQRVWIPALLILAGIAACSDVDKVEISQLLDARDQAISHRNISEYSFLIAADYSDRDQSKVDIVAQMVSLFDRFEQAEMASYDRQIRRLNDTQALCEQSYKLRVYADGQWRQIVQREQLQLTRKAGGWKISGGL